MWRALFTAIGAALLILGGECLVVEKAVFASAPAKAVAPTSPFDDVSAAQPPAKREFRPPEWAPWSLLSAGAVIMLYTFSLSHNRE